jgi:hypothetical protein
MVMILMQVLLLIGPGRIGPSGKCVLENPGTCAEFLRERKKIFEKKKEENGHLIFTVLTNCRNVINQTPRSFFFVFFYPQKLNQDKNDETYF